MLNRLHARSEWKHLYFCGDSTVMATGAPATTVSGVGAANVILRELHLPEYDSRKFPKHYVNIVDLPYRRPDYRPTEVITDRNAYLAAAQCQGCQEPACVDGCPAGVDIPGFMRRMEAKNYSGAARLIRKKNPFGEVCGMVCRAGRLCQQDCYRRDFAGVSVRIAELQRWVCAEAGENGWIKFGHPAPGPKVAVVGGGPSALTCAYYLTLTGCKVSVFAKEAQPGGTLWQKTGSDPALCSAVQRDVQGVMSTGIGFEGDRCLGKGLDLQYFRENYRAIYLPEAGLKTGENLYDTWLGTDWRNSLDQQSGQVSGLPDIFVGEEFILNDFSVVEAVARGRKAAFSITQFLSSQAG